MMYSVGKPNGRSLKIGLSLCAIQMMDSGKPIVVEALKMRISLYDYDTLRVIHFKYHRNTSVQSWKWYMTLCIIIIGQYTK